MSQDAESSAEGLYYALPLLIGVFLPCFLMFVFQHFWPHWPQPDDTPSIPAPAVPTIAVIVNNPPPPPNTRVRAYRKNTNHKMHAVGSINVQSKEICVIFEEVVEKGNTVYDNVHITPCECVDLPNQPASVNCPKALELE